MMKKHQGARRTCDCGECDTCRKREYRRRQSAERRERDLNHKDPGNQEPVSLSEMSFARVCSRVHGGTRKFEEQLNLRLKGAVSL